MTIASAARSCLQNKTSGNVHGLPFTPTSCANNTKHAQQRQQYRHEHKHALVVQLQTTLALQYYTRSNSKIQAVVTRRLQYASLHSVHNSTIGVAAEPAPLRTF
jgi:hypothetical protein